MKNLSLLTSILFLANIVAMEIGQESTKKDALQEENISISTSNTNFENFPAEIILEIITKMEYCYESLDAIRALEKTCKKTRESVYNQIFKKPIAKLLINQKLYDELDKFDAENPLNWNMVKELVGRGSDPNLKLEFGYQGYTPFIYAIVDDPFPQGKYDMGIIIQFLIDHGANINTKDINGNTALMHIFYRLTRRNPGFHWIEDMDILKVLIKNGANLNEKQSRGHSLLVMAIQQSLYHVVELLINNGIEINSVDKYKKTALDYALDKNRLEEEIGKLLEKHGAKRGSEL